MGLDFIKKFMRKHWISYSAGVILMLITTRVRLLYPDYLGKATDLMVSSGFTWQGLRQYILLIILISVISFIGSYYWRYLVIGNSRYMEKELRELVFTNFQALSQSFYNKRKTGDLIAYGINDVNAVRMTFGPALIMSINGVAIIGISISGLIEKIGLARGLQVLIPIPIVVIAMLKMGTAIRERFRRVQESFGTISDRVNENINGIRVIKAYVQEETEVDKFEVLSRDMADKNISMVKVSGLLNPVIQTGFAVTFGIFFLVCGPMAIRGEITVGDFVAGINYLNMMMMPITSIGRIINIMQRGMASLGRIDEILEYPHEITDGTGKATEFKTGKVDIEDLDFTYPGTDREVLKDITLHLPNGKSLGIIGATGSGKTTLVSLLLKTYNVPDGKIFIDDKDINDYTLALLRDNIGYVPQDNFLFHDTISENIKFFKDIYSEEDVHNAAKDAQIYDSIVSLDKGFDTILGDRGVNLSGGQKQRISIARALIRNPKILILDDALSAVDTVTESKILKRLKEIRKDKSTIIIAHRISAVMGCDEIIVLDDGKIMERGSHKELLEKKGGMYSGIYSSQFEDTVTEAV